jgi:hypothetical protein
VVVACEKNNFAGEYHEERTSDKVIQEWCYPSQVHLTTWVESHEDAVLDCEPLAYAVQDAVPIKDKDVIGAVYIPGNNQQLKLNVGDGSKTFFDYLFATERNNPQTFNGPHEEDLALAKIQYFTQDAEYNWIKIPTRLRCETIFHPEGKIEKRYTFCLATTLLHMRDILENRYIVEHDLFAQPKVFLPPLETYDDLMSDEELGSSALVSQLDEEVVRQDWVNEKRFLLQSSDPRRKGVLTIYAILAKL